MRIFKRVKKKLESKLIKINGKMAKIMMVFEEKFYSVLENVPKHNEILVLYVGDFKEFERF